MLHGTVITCLLLLRSFLLFLKQITKNNYLIIEKTLFTVYETSCLSSSPAVSTVHVNCRTLPSGSTSRRPVLVAVIDCWGLSVVKKGVAT